MSHPLTFAAITAVLQDILANGLTSDLTTASIGEVMVTALPPDQVSVTGDDRPQINLFLYHVSQNPNADWTTQNFNARSAHAQEQSNAFCLALNLHYLLTAYGTKNFQCELLLGSAIQLFHETPVLEQERIFNILKRGQSSNSFGILSKALAQIQIQELSQEIGTVKLCPELLNVEETSKLWSSLQTHYRPSIAYQVSTLVMRRRK